MANFKTGLGNNIKLLRKLRNITQEELSELIGIHPRQLSKIETGEHFPSCKTLERLCIALEITPQEMFDFEFLAEENICALTGTDNSTIYRVESSTSSSKSNVYQLHTETETKELTATKCTDETMAKTAKALNKPVFAEYFENGKSSKIVVFYPDGREKVIRNSSDVEVKQNLIYMMKEFKKIQNDKAATDFVKLALNSLSDNKSLEQLSNIIQGMKLARNLK